MKNIMWHIGTRQGTAELQDVVAAAISIGEIDLLSALLKAMRVSLMIWGWRTPGSWSMCGETG